MDTPQAVNAAPVPMFDPAQPDALWTEPAPAPAVAAPETQAEAAPAAVEPAPETPETPVVEAPAAETPEVETPAVTEEAGEQPPPTTVPDKILPGRISVKQFSQTEQEAIALRHRYKQAGEDVPTLKEALEIVERQQAQAHEAAAKRATEQASIPTPPTADELAAEVDTLEREINEAGENESLMTPELAKKVTAMARKSAQLERMKLEVVQSTRAVDQQKAEAAKVRDQVVADYPGIDNPKTFLGARAAALIGEMRDPSHPDHSRLYEPNVNRFVAQTATAEVAEQLGTTPEALVASLRGKAPEAKAAPANTAPKPVAGNKAIAPAPGTKAAVAPVVAPVNEKERLRQGFTNPSLYDDDLWPAETPRLALGGR